MLKFRCKNCDQKIGVPDDWRGHVVRCPRCKQGVDVPSNAELVNKPLPPPRAPTQQTESIPAPTRTPQPFTSEPAPIPIAAAPQVSAPAPQPAIEAPAPASIHLTTPPIALTPVPRPVPAIVAETPRVEVPPLEVQRPAPVAIEATIKRPEPEPVPLKPTAAPAKASAKAPKKNKAEPKSAKPIKPAIAAQVAQPEPATTAIPAPTAPEIPTEPAASESPVILVTVARRDEVEPSPLADPETGNVVNLAEALTQSVVTPKPIVTSSAATSDLASVFSSGAAPEIPAMIDVEQTAPPTPVAVTVVEPVSIPKEPESIVTSVTMDAASPFAGSQPQSEPFVETMGSNRALSEIVDELPSEGQSPEGASAATDLLDTLSRTSQESHPPDGPVTVHAHPQFAPALAPRKEKPRKPANATLAALVVAVLAMLSAAGSLALCVTPSHAHLSVPAGVAGLLLAVLATGFAQGRSGIAAITGVGAAVASVIAIAIGVLIGLGMLPGSAAYARRQLAKHLPAARAGDVEVRVRSASVMHPVLMMSPKKVGPTAQTATQSVLRLEVELRNFSDHTAAQYTSWAGTSARAEPVWLHDDEGNSLKPLSASGAVPPGRSSEVVMIKPNGGTVGDVLLFEAPPMRARELDLQLPGNNVGSLQPLQIHIPAEMFARQ